MWSVCSYSFNYNTCYFTLRLELVVILSSNFKFMHAINPATEEHLIEYSDHTDEDINQLIVHTYNAHLRWSKTDFTHRSDLMKKAAEVLRSRKTELSILMTQEMGKPV